jgi:hypothetical protein
MNPIIDLTRSGPPVVDVKLACPECEQSFIVYEVEFDDTENTDEVECSCGCVVEVALTFDVTFMLTSRPKKPKKPPTKAEQRRKAKIKADVRKYLRGEA